MPTYKGSNKIGKVYKGSTKIGKIYKGSTLVYHSAYAVTYCVDSSTSYTELVKVGNSCLSPTTFTPTKSGWTFVGWREDKTASSNVLTSKSMASSAITLYAVFKQTITVTYYDNSTTAATKTGTRYYNNGNTVDPSFTLAQADKSGWSKRGWSTTNAGNANITYNDNTAFTRSSNCTLYGLYQQTITVTYYNNSTTAKTKTGTRYWAPAGAIDPTFTIAQSAVSGWTKRGWSTGTSGNANITYNDNTAFTRSSNCTLYGSYSKTITVTYYNNSTTAKTKTGTAYRNYEKTETGASFTLAQAAKSGWTKLGWSTGTTGNASANYSDNTAFTRTSDCTLYGLYSKTITLSYDGNGATGGSVSAQTGTRYYNSSGNYKNPSFTLKSNGFTKTNYEFTGWDLGAVGASITLDANKTAYAQWKVLATSYTVNIPNYPMTDISSDSNHEYEVVVNNGYYYLWAKKNPDSNAWGNAAGRVSLPTQNCNKVRIKYYVEFYESPGDKMTINGQLVGAQVYQDTYLYLDCSGDTFTLTASLTNADDYNRMTLWIKEVYFYYE